MTDMSLWGFDGSTDVRSVKMLPAEKAFTEFTQVPLNVLKGEPKSPEHLQRHPFGLFSDFVGAQNAAARASGIDTGRRVLRLLMDADTSTAERPDDPA